MDHYLKSTNEIIELYDVDISEGLTSVEASARLEKYGKMLLKSKKAQFDQSDTRSVKRRVYYYFDHSGYFKSCYVHFGMGWCS